MKQTEANPAISPFKWFWLQRTAERSDLALPSYFQTFFSVFVLTSSHGAAASVRSIC